MAGFLADVIVAVHLAYVVFVVGGQVFVLIGAARGWKWARNFWFRTLHLIAIGLVVLVEALGVRCPMTVWEENLRVRAGQPTSGETFLGRLFHSVLFYTDIPQWVFTAMHVSFGAIVLVTFVLYLPRRPFPRAEPPAGVP